MSASPQTSVAWPPLDWAGWQDTAATLHLFTQIVGKTRLAFTPLQNHWWNVPLYVTARGLGTSAIPLPAGGVLDVEFDFLEHTVVLRHSRGDLRTVSLQGCSVAAFYAAFMAALDALGIAVTLDPLPVELPNPLRFDADEVHATYDGAAARRFWQALVQAHAIFRKFSTRFYGKASPVHFFWGSFDLAVTRFNGRRAPARAGADGIQSEAYSHECISAGFWPGNGGYGQAAFYCYAAPVPAGLADAQIPGPGTFDRNLGEFLLNYADVRTSADPEQTVLDFLEHAYGAAADAAQWDRAALERRR